MKLKNLFTLVIVVLFFANIASLSAQIPACTGWNNPTSFNFASSAQGNEVYRGRTGTKTATAGNCATGVTGVTLNSTMITAANLATTTDNGASYDCGGTVGPSNQFRIMSATDYPNGKDPLVGNAPGLSVLPPSTFGAFTKSIRLGNCQNSAHAEALYYDFDVNFENSLMLLNYAIVVQAPGHGIDGDPTFWVRVLVETTPGSNNFTTISPGYCYVVSSTPTTSGGSVTIGQDGWHAYGSGYSQIFYREWDQIAISLSDFIYRRVRIEVIMGDCFASGHYGYCYIAGSCQPMSLISTGCESGESDTVTFVQAPSGLDAYKWYYYPDGINPDSSDVDPVNYVEINDSATNTDRLAVRSRYFLPRNFTLNDDTLNKQTTILCRMTSNSTVSYFRTDINNLKPIIKLDTIYSCDNMVELTDVSTAYSVNGGSGVDYLLSEWIFYDSSETSSSILVTDTATGPTVIHTFDHKGNHSVRLRSYSIDSTGCYAEKVIGVRSLSAPIPRIDFSSSELSAGDLVTIYDNTVDTLRLTSDWSFLQSNYHHWHLYNEKGFDTTIVTMQNYFDIRLMDTCWVELTCHVENPYWIDTNQDGIPEKLYCDGTARRMIYVDNNMDTLQPCPLANTPELVEAGSGNVLIRWTSDSAVSGYEVSFGTDTLSPENNAIMEVQDTVLHITSGLRNNLYYACWLRNKCHQESAMFDTNTYSDWSAALVFYLAGDTTTIGTVDEVKIHIYPNPANEHVTVQTEGIPIQYLELYDNQGRLVERVSRLEDRGKCQLSIVHLPAGHYVVRVITPIGTAKHTFIKE